MRQPENIIPGTPRDWLRYARSSFAPLSAPRQEGVRKAFEQAGAVLEGAGKIVEGGES